MGARSRARRAQRAWLLPLLLPLLRAVRAWVRGLRPRAAWALGRRLGGLFDLVGLRRALLRRNVRVACGGLPPTPVLRRFERAYYRHLGLLIVEWLRQPLITPETLGRHFEPEGLAHLRRVYDEGRGVIFATGHAGLWELAGHAAGLLGLKLTAVAKLSGYAELDGFVLEVREAGGQRIRDARGSTWALKKALDRGEAVGIVVDQEARQNVVFAPFLGVAAATSATPARLHLKTGAPIVCVTVLREGPFRYRLALGGVIRRAPTGDHEADVAAVTADVNAATERLIRERPEQWFWSHRRWRRRPQGEPAVEVPPRDPAVAPLDLTRATLW